MIKLVFVKSSKRAVAMFLVVLVIMLAGRVVVT